MSDCPLCGQPYRGSYKSHMYNRCPEYTFKQGENAGLKRKDLEKAVTPLSLKKRKKLIP